MIARDLDSLGAGVSAHHPQPPWERILWTKVVPFLVLVNIGLNPFPHYTTYREVSYYSALLLLVGYLVRHRDWRAFRTPLTLPGALFAGWALVGLFWALDFGASLHDIRAHLLKYIGLFLLVTTFFQGRDKIRLLLWVILLSVLVSGWHDIYTFYVVGKNSLLARMLIPDHQLPVGPMGFMALYAMVLATHLFRCSDQGMEKWALALCSAGLLVILLATQMRSLLVALPLVGIVLCWDNKKLLAVVLVGVALCTVGTFKLRLGSAYNDRLTLNYISFLLIKEHPITGVGYSMETPGNHALIDHEGLRAQVPAEIRHQTVEYNNPHNMWLELAIRMGVLGPFLFLAVLVAGGRVCLAAMGQGMNRELRLAGQLCLSLLALFPVYGLFNVVFTHLLELLLSVLLALIALVALEVNGPGPRGGHRAVS